MTSHIKKIIDDFMRDTRNLLRENLVEEYLFGSFSNDTQINLSDIDILIIVRKNKPEIRKQMSVLSSDYSLNQDVVISPVIKDVDIWEKNKKYNTQFYQEIEKYGVKL